MTFRHPFEWLTETGQRRAFLPLFIITLIVMAGMLVTGAPLKSEASPMGITSFEYAGELAVAHAMIKSWGPQGQLYVGLNMGLDFLFLVVYPLTIGLGCVLLSRRLSGGAGFVGSLGVVLAWGQLLAGLLDVVEDYALIQVLLGTENELWPALAAWCATPKFLLVALGLLYLIIGGIAAVVLPRKA